MTSAQRQNALKEAEVIGELCALWPRVQTERDRNRKGKFLEELVKLLFRATPGFGRVTTRLDNEIQEIDIKVDNRSDDPICKGEGAYLIGECKMRAAVLGDRG